MGTVGIPVPGTTIRIAEDGEILVKGIGVFKGYHANAAANAEAFVDGFFRTGDLGSLDEDGFLTITGRKKDLLVTAGGKNVAPGPLEEKIREHQLVGQAVVLGDGRPFVSALVNLDPEGLENWCAAAQGSRHGPCPRPPAMNWSGRPSRAPWTRRTRWCPRRSPSAASSCWTPISRWNPGT